MDQEKTINKSSTTNALFKNTGIIAIGQISTKVVNFFLLPLYTAILSTEEYGLVDLLTTYSAVIIVIVGLQMNQAVFRFLVTCRDDEDKKREVISTITFTTIIVCTIYAGVFAVIQPFINLECKWFLLWYVIAALFLQTASGIARGLGYNANYAAGNFISASMALVLNVLFIAVLRLGVGMMLTAYIIGPIAGSLFQLWKTKIYRYISIKAYNRSELKTVLQYSIPLIPNELSWSIIHASDRMVVSAVLSVAANGLVAVASKFSTIYTTAFSIFNTSWTEQVILHYKDKGGAKYISDMFEEMVTFFGCLAIGIVAIMPFIFNILVNKKFDAAFNLIPFYMMAVFFNAIIGMISAIYLIENETKLIAISTMVAAAINLLVDIAFIKIIGVYAAPISSICGYATISFWRLYDINKRHCKIAMPLKKVIALLALSGITFAGYFSRKKFVQIAVLFLVVVGAYLLNRKFIHDLAQTFQQIVRKKR